jgi:hypothetical protein
MAELERVVTLNGMARPGMPVQEASTLQPWSTFTGGADDDDWDYENESAPEPDFNGGGGAPLEAEAQVPEFDGGGVTESEAQVPEFDGGGESEPEAEAAEELEDDFDADSEPEDAATRWDNVGGGWVHQDKDSESESNQSSELKFQNLMISENGNTVADLLESIAWSLKRITAHMEK